MLRWLEGKRQIKYIANIFPVAKFCTMRNWNIHIKLVPSSKHQSNFSRRRIIQHLNSEARKIHSRWDSTWCWAQPRHAMAKWPSHAMAKGPSHAMVQRIFHLYNSADPVQSLQTWDGNKMNCNSFSCNFCFNTPWNRHEWNSFRYTYKTSYNIKPNV